MPPLTVPREVLHDHIEQFRDLLLSASHLSRRDPTPNKLSLPDLTLSSPLATRTSHTLEPAVNPFRTLSSLIRRQTIVAIPATYAGINAGPPPGTVVGITLGSVAGFLLLLWLFYTCSNMGGGRDVVAEEVVRRRSRSPPRRRSRSPRRSSRAQSEMMESRRSRSPQPRRESRRETIVVEERRAPPPVVLEREDDIVEVIEEHSPPRRARSNRDRNSGGYRPVDPDAYAGGNRPMRKVRR